MKQRRRARGSSSHSEPPLLSIQLDPLVWDALRDIAGQQARTVGDLVMEIAGDSLRIAIRIYIEEFYRAGKDRPR